MATVLPPLYLNSIFGNREYGQSSESRPWNRRHCFISFYPLGFSLSFEILIRRTSLNGGISRLSLSNSICMTVSQNAWIHIAAVLSSGVFYRLTTTSLPPRSDTSAGMSAAGVTRRLDPIAMQRSAWPAYWNPALITLESRFSPKLMIVSRSSPLQAGLSHLLPVKWSWTFWAVLTLKSRIYSFLHLLHFSKFVFPWSSAN